MHLRPVGLAWWHVFVQSVVWNCFLSVFFPRFLSVWDWWTAWTEFWVKGKFKLSSEISSSSPSQVTDQRVENSLLHSSGQCLTVRDLQRRFYEQMCGDEASSIAPPPLKNADCLIHLIAFPHPSEVEKTTGVWFKKLTALPRHSIWLMRFGFLSRSAPFLSCFEGERWILVLDVEDSFVVAWEVVFKNEAFASRKTTHA